MKRGKKYNEAVKLFDKSAQYEASEAISLVKKSAVAKFDETIEAHIRLGVDGRHADQQVRGAVVLPHGTGKTVKVLVFAKGDKVQLIGFGTFEVKERAEREGRNPSTGETIKIAASKNPAFSAGKAFKDAVN